MAFSPKSQEDPRAELFDPDEDCSTDEQAGGGPEGRCALIPECQLRCVIRREGGESQYNDWLVDGGAPPPDLRPELRD